MAGDYSRDTFDPTKHYQRVLIQEGRVFLDADWREQTSIDRHRARIEMRDVIGPSGAPRYDGGFEIGLTPGGHDLTISPGRMYVNGLPVEVGGAEEEISSTTGQSEITLGHLIFDGHQLAAGDWLAVKVGGIDDYVQIHEVRPADSVVTLETQLVRSGPGTIRRVVTYFTQPDFTPPQVALTDGRYLVYLDVFPREISAIEDPDIREIALGGPDTARREKLVWILRVLRVGDVDCPDPIPELDDLTRASTGFLAARTKPSQDQPDPCHLPPTAGYRGMENRLYRVEIQRGGDFPPASGSAPAFKWSNDDACLEEPIDHISGNDITLAENGKDDFFRFFSDQWVEIVDEASTLESNPNALRQILTAEASSRVITLQSAPPITTGTNLKLRGWQQQANATADGVVMGSDWTDLEYDIQVRFADGHYCAGDYWLIPARTAIQDILWPRFDDATPEPRPPAGTRHEYVRLAILVNSTSALNEARTAFGFGAAVSLHDCRKLFPPLTHICADDVCFNNLNCQLPQATNVQQAIDALCAARDLRFHNKMLHGFGVVCGLQLSCAGEASVLVKSGYALDCEGNDILLNTRQVVDLSKLEGWSGFVQRDKVCLSIERGANGPVFRLRTPPAVKPLPEAVADGTLLNDFLNVCLGPLQSYYDANLKLPPDDDAHKNTVSEAQMRLTALGNLLIQLRNPTDGSKVFLSPREHALLAQMYAEVRKLISSSTNCALTQDLRPMPDYPFQSPPVETIFGKGLHRRVRVNPNNQNAYTFGDDHRILVFDGPAGVLLRQLSFPLTTATVQDVAISPDGNSLFVIALSGDTTYFSTTPASTEVWQPAVQVPNLKLLTLVTAVGGQRVFAVAFDKGIFELRRDGTVQPAAADINARGHMVIDERFRLVIASAAFPDAVGAVPPTKYNGYYYYFLSQNGSLGEGKPVLLQREGDDDLALASDFGGDRPDVYIVVDPIGAQTSKRAIVLPYHADGQHQEVDLEANTTIHLAAIPLNASRRVAVAYEDAYDVRYISGRAQSGDDIARLDLAHVPVQICPTSIALSPGNQVYILNRASSTLSRFDESAIVDPTPIDLSLLIEYRNRVINAYLDLAGALLETIKDCFCEHLLIDCPICTESDLVYLGCIELREGIVRSICNLELRKYVRTFRTVEWWLSLVPLIPAIAYAVERLCCFDFLSWFRGHKWPQPGDPDTLQCDTAAAFRTAVSSISTALRDRQVPAKAFGRILSDALLHYQRPPIDPVVNPPQLIGQPVALATQQLAGNGIHVQRVENYDPALGVRNATRALTSFDGVPAVVIVQRDGKVAYFHDRVSPSDVIDLSAGIDRATAAAAIANTSAGQVATSLDAVRTAAEEAKRTAADNQQAVAATNQRVDQLSTTTTADVAGVRQNITDIQLLIKQRDSAIQEAITLGDRVNSLQANLAEIVKSNADTANRLTNLENLRAKIKKPLPNG